MNREEVISETIDRVITVDVHGRGVIYHLYTVARNFLGKPLAFSAAKAIIDNVKKGDYVFLITGFRVPPNFIQESDGPPGIVVLARILAKVLRTRNILFIEDESRDILINALSSVNIKLSESEDIKPGQAFIATFPKDFDSAYKAAEEVIGKYSPSLVLCLEKVGMNSKGVYHNMEGYDVSDYQMKIEPLIEYARRNGILTIGVGDGGNEVGMGNIATTIKEFIPYGKKCRCPCKGGIVAVSKVDILVASTTSNWGGYGIEACIAYLAGKPRYMHKPIHERKILRATIDSGAIDGVTREATYSVDAIPEKVHYSIVEILNSIISQ